MNLRQTLFAPDRSAEEDPVYLSDSRELDFYLWELFRVDKAFLENAPYQNVDRIAVAELLKNAQIHSANLAAAYYESDRDPARRVDDHNVHIPRPYHALWREHMQEWFWMRQQVVLSKDNDQHAARQFPQLVTQVVMEQFLGANPAFMQFSGFTPSAAILVRQFGTELQQKIFLDKLETAEWDGCFCATEDEAGSDLLAVQTTAEHIEEETYAIRGEKVFITAGMHPLTENTVHVVIGRLRGTSKSPLSLSCFLVPRFWPEPDGTLSPNNVVCAEVADKMGLKGCPNTRLVFGRDRVTRGLLLGDKPGVALLQLSNLMRRARIETGITGVALASSAYLHAARYARQRVQGIPFDKSSNPWASKVAIIQHLDVQRMLLEMKSKIEGSRMLVGRIAFHASMLQIEMNRQEQTGEAVNQDEIDRHARLISLYGPIAKGYISEEAWTIVAQAIQVHGAVGYLRTRPLEQYARDLKVLTIWEGTTYIQAQDLVRDKLGFGRKSVVMRDFEDEVRRSLAKASEYPELASEFEAVTQALHTLKAALEAIGDHADNGKLLLVSQYCTRFLTMFGEVIVAWNLLDAACVAVGRLREISDDHVDRDFYSGKLKSVRYFAHNVLPHHACVAQLIKQAEFSFVEAEPFEFGIGE